MRTIGSFYRLSRPLAGRADSPCCGCRTRSSLSPVHVGRRKNAITEILPRQLAQLGRLWTIRRSLPRRGGRLFVGGLSRRRPCTMASDHHWRLQRRVDGGFRRCTQRSRCIHRRCRPPSACILAPQPQRAPRLVLPNASALLGSPRRPLALHADAHRV